MFNKNHLETLAIAYGGTLRTLLDDKNVHSRIQSQIYFWRALEHLMDSLGRNSKVFTKQHFISEILYYAHLNREEDMTLKDVFNDMDADIVRFFGEDMLLELDPDYEAEQANDNYEKY